MKVLLVEDEPGIREGMSDLISEQAEVVAPERVEDALAALAADRFELVLTDLSMEGDRHAGFRVIEQARRRLFPTALLTGSVLEDEQRPPGPFELQGMLVKPFSLDSAVSLLDRYVGLGRALLEAAAKGEGAHGAAVWTVLSRGEALSVPGGCAGLGFQVIEGELSIPSGRCGPGERGFLVPGERSQVVAQGPVRLVTLPIEAL
jgi:CheY-like chemotaxis protein